jgi:hypothetical protein
MSNDKPQLISRKRHYFYVVVFSIVIWAWVAGLIALFIPVYIEDRMCSCRLHLRYSDISFKVFGLSGLIWGVVFSFPLHRWGLVSVANKSDKFVPLSRFARYGKFLIGWRGIVIIIMLAGTIPFGLFVKVKLSRPFASGTYPYSDVTVLHCAVRHQDINTIQREIKHGADVNAKLKGGETPLHFATQNAYSEHGVRIVRILIENGADVNALDSSNNSPLHWASNWGRERIYKLLIDNGAKINAINSDGETPLDWAINEDEYRNQKLLRSHGAKTGAELKKEFEKR